MCLSHFILCDPAFTFFNATVPISLCKARGSNFVLGELINQTSQKHKYLQVGETDRALAPASPSTGCYRRMQKSGKIPSFFA